jgi:diguanylate cyclase (GGDEF)-like protein
MTQQTPDPFEIRLHTFRVRWEHYLAAGGFDQFVEFAVALNSLVEQFSRLRLPGLVRLCEGLENVVLAHIGENATHPIPEQDTVSLQRQMDTLFAAVASAIHPIVPELRHNPSSIHPADSDWVKPRAVWIFAAEDQRELAAGLCRQLKFFGFLPEHMTWACPAPAEAEPPLAVLFIPVQDRAAEDAFDKVATIRARCPTSQLFYLGVQGAIESIVKLMRAGVDVTIPASEQSAGVLNRVLDLVQTFEQEKYRVLVVEDSRVAVAMIQRTLSEHGIDSHAITDPGTLLDALADYRPDLILMDMYMPRFNGVEATRAIRQLSDYHSIPIVYLSGESAVSMQVEALRLGGDQFLTKPFNPVVLAAVVKTKIERYRETQRSTRLDGLTGLYNHTAAKSRLHAMVNAVPEGGTLAVAMLDIDHFKAVNDTYGHPVGDQVIRGLAWLLKGRLRSSDLIGRYGGEEFLIALPDADEGRVRAVIDRIRMDFAELPHAHANGALYATFSAGVACFPRHGSAAGLTEAADNALLEAKRLGRNRVEQ